jgi:hypothetical protein
MQGETKKPLESVTQALEIADSLGHPSASSEHWKELRRYTQRVRRHQDDIQNGRFRSIPQRKCLFKQNLNVAPSVTKELPSNLEPFLMEVTHSVSAT